MTNGELVVTDFRSFTRGVEAATVSGTTVDAAGSAYSGYKGIVLDQDGDYTNEVVDASGIYDIASRLEAHGEVFLLSKTGGLVLRTTSGEPLSTEQYEAACAVVEAFNPGDVPLSMDTSPLEASSSD
jgi:hypothetical protein